MAIVHEPPPRRAPHRGPKFSLLALMWVMLLVAVACTLGVMFPRLIPEIVLLTVTAWASVLVYRQQRPLWFYLHYLNPAVALLVLAICMYSAMEFHLGDKSFEFKGPFQGGIPTYFLGKGIFCSAALFLLGKLVEQNLREPE